MNASVNKLETKKPSHLFDYLSLIIIITGLVLFYVLKINVWLKWGIILLTVVGATALFFLVSETGLNLHAYLRDTWRELGKVVWPTRKEATQFTWIVFLFVAVLALFLWLVDSGISWLLYSIVLGKS
ncbi:MAG: preprotein translocase subunit SecE [Burkholderiales bacterium]|nr:preprotein translocase subunit SecE [Burkholderiales bacterium]